MPLKGDEPSKYQFAKAGQLNKNWFPDVYLFFISEIHTSATHFTTNFQLNLIERIKTYTLWTNWLPILMHRQCPTVLCENIKSTMFIAIKLLQSRLDTESR